MQTKKMIQLCHPSFQADWAHQDCQLEVMIILKWLMVLSKRENLVIVILDKIFTGDNMLGGRIRRILLNRFEK